MNGTEIKSLEDFRALRNKAHNYLLEELGYSPGVAGNYKNAWRRMQEFMQTHGIVCFDQSVAQRFLKHEFGKRTKKDLSGHERFRLNGARMLVQFFQTGEIDTPTTPTKPRPPQVLKGVIGERINQFIKYKREKESLSQIRLRCYERTLLLFWEYCKANNIDSINALNLPILLNYIKELDTNKTTIYIAISTLRNLLMYWYKQGLTLEDYSKKLPRYKRVQQPKLPSTYSKEEIEKLLSTVPRDSSIGKRNYAILLLAARLGLRASDISFLKFAYLDWEQSILSFHQIKTGKLLTLPLLSDVGNAIIDYLKYGRPKSDSPYVFLTGRPPFGRFTTSNVVTHIVQRAFKKSGIDTQGRRFGSHALRHSLGFELLQSSTTLPVISEVLGHKSTESTRYYLRIDLASMRQCVLEVPSVPASFYEQKGGIFYE